MSDQAEHDVLHPEQDGRPRERRPRQAGVRQPGEDIFSLSLIYSPLNYCFNNIIKIILWIFYQGGSNYRVCYSNHASLTELEQFIRHFAPLQVKEAFENIFLGYILSQAFFSSFFFIQITPCAIPPNSSREEVRDILASFLSDEDSLVLSSSCPREAEETEVRSGSSLSSGSRKRKLSSCGSLNFSESNSFEEK